jgi:signal recognition particle receptor subunit beta
LGDLETRALYSYSPVYCTGSAFFSASATSAHKASRLKQKSHLLRLDMSAFEYWAQAIFSPSPLGLAIAIILVLTIPLFLHSIIFRASGLTTLPSILLLGPSGSGKTSLLTLVSSLVSSQNARADEAQFERGATAETHTSQTPIEVECSLPVGEAAASDQYRSVNDLADQVHKKFLLIDTPGHGKLRHHALEHIANPQNLKGLIFLVDAAALSAGDEGLRQTADYLHDVLLLLQKMASNPKTAKTLKDISVLVAANKMDLFTALPAALAKNSLESEITKVRTSRSKGLLDSGIGIDDADEDKDDWLGEMGSSEFKFAQMEEFNVTVEVSGGNVLGGDGPSVEKWWKWVSQML